ncbi:hypothetical protein O7608_24700 [Solwaraspora sp. WMMA2056]|uniref:hypothetical protein n=1 Tax=Solwaraspora sp. WMMA2056 TaxID=3015161 RepID=UPI00259B1790|nr:hypothetical protein [Solwaraspora sp. WMMA2056]WJK44226.1 hypothetical protein O7608_24700 [Solwaraspora sp. WMMA2056]
MTGNVLLAGGIVVTCAGPDEVLWPADVLIDNGVIAAIGRDLPAGDAQRVDVSGRIVMPGLVDTHRHTWQAVVRNIASDWTLDQYLVGLHVGLSRYFRPEDTYAGLRAVFAHGGGAQQWGGVMPSPVPHPEADVRRLRAGRFVDNTGLVTMGLALRGPQFSTLEVTKGDFQLARELDLRVSVHVGDGHWGKIKPIHQMNGEGLLSDQVTYVHCNTLADDELRLSADTGGTASIAPDVEMQMGHGWPATGRLLDLGCPAPTCCASPPSRARGPTDSARSTARWRSARRRTS